MADRNHTERINFGKLKEVIQPPNLIEIQINSYLDYLQKGVPDKQRKPQGLEAVFREVFPMKPVRPALALPVILSVLARSSCCPKRTIGCDTRCRCRDGSRKFLST